MSTKKEIAIDTSAILVTFKCNLRCKLCCTSAPYQENPVHFPLERLESVLNRYFEVVKFIRKLSFGGGEPMLRQDMDKLIEITMKHRNQIDIFEIITNGTIIPDGKILDTMEKYKETMFIMIDNYGTISKNADKLSLQFTERGIRHSVRIYYGEEAHCGGWVDLGDFQHKHNSDTAKKLYGKCVIANTTKNHTGVYNSIPSETESLLIPYIACTDGLLHRCARAYATMEAGSIDKNTGDFIDIMDNSKTVEQIRDSIHKLMLVDYISACEYCNGFDSNSKRYMPAEQL